MEPPLVRIRPTSGLLRRSWVALGAVVVIVEVALYASPQTAFVPSAVRHWLSDSLFIVVIVSLVFVIIGVGEYLWKYSLFVVSRWCEYGDWVAFGLGQKAIVDRIPTALARQAMIFGSQGYIDFMPCFVMHRARIVDKRITVVLRPVTHVANRYVSKTGDVFVLVDNAFPQIHGHVTTIEQQDVQSGSIEVSVGEQNIDALLLTALWNKALSSEIIDIDITAIPIDHSSSPEGAVDG